MTLGQRRLKQCAFLAFAFPCLRMVLIVMRFVIYGANLQKLFVSTIYFANFVRCKAWKDATDKEENILRLQCDMCRSFR